MQRVAQDAQMTDTNETSTEGSQHSWPAKLLPLLILLFTGTVSTLIAQHIIDRVSGALAAWKSALSVRRARTRATWHRCLSTMLLHGGSHWQ